MRILVVDDNVDLTQMFTLMLELYGHSAKSCNDPLEAVAIATAYIPDVAILDIGMPRLNGYELCQQLRAVPSLSDMKIVAQSGYADVQSRQKSEEVGFDLHLMKPVPPEELHVLLRQWQAELDGSREENAG